jgi:hypothetical protein
MIGKLLTVIIIFTIGWLIYANFFGTAAEKQIANQITSSFKGLAGGVTSAIKNEADKGTFTKAMESTTKAITTLREGDKNGEYTAKIAALEAERKQLEGQLEQGQKLKSTIDKTKSDEKVKQQLNDLADKINVVSEEMKNNKK